MTRRAWIPDQVWDDTIIVFAGGESGDTLPQKKPPFEGRFLQNMATTYFHNPKVTIIGAEGLNCCVRDGNRCGPFARVTKSCFSGGEKQNSITLVRSGVNRDAAAR